MASPKMAVETDTSVASFEYEWKIKNFLKYYNNLRGEAFSPVKSLPLKFALELEPRKSNPNGNLDYTLSLIKLSKEKVPDSCRVEIYVKIDNGPNYLHNITVKPGNTCLLEGSDSICLFKGFLQTSTNNFYVNNTYLYANTEYISFLCTFTFFGFNVTTVSNSDPVLQMSHERLSDICSGLESLYESKAYSDITFEIGESTLKAHRCILVAQSPVFKKMFENNLAESETNCIQIADFDVHVYDCFLKYLYCGEMKDASFDVVMDLFALADKYSVDGLARDCRVILAKSLTIDNVCKVLVLSYLHNYEILKAKCMQFINHHFSFIRKKTEWTNLVDDNPKLASEYFSCVSANWA